MNFPLVVILPIIVEVQVGEPKVSVRARHDLARRTEAPVPGTMGNSVNDAASKARSSRPSTCNLRLAARPRGGLPLAWPFQLRHSVRRRSTIGTLIDRALPTRCLRVDLGKRPRPDAREHPLLHFWLPALPWALATSCQTSA